MNELREFIATLGFPIFVAVWLLVRDYWFVQTLIKHMATVEAILLRLTKSIEEK